MIELLQFLFATEKDQYLYLNKNALVKELLHEHQFTFNEVNEMLEWFAPILNDKICSDVSADAVREITLWEKQRLPESIIEQIIQWEHEQLINSSEREILFDRLTMLNPGWMVSQEEVREILDGLIFHLQNYKNRQVDTGMVAATYCHPNNFTVH